MSAGMEMPAVLASGPALFHLSGPICLPVGYKL